MGLQDRDYYKEQLKEIEKEESIFSKDKPTLFLKILAIIIISGLLISLILFK